jgi:hypothetical protein
MNVVFFPISTDLICSQKHTILTVNIRTLHLIRNSSKNWFNFNEMFGRALVKAMLSDFPCEPK